MQACAQPTELRQVACIQHADVSNHFCVCHVSHDVPPPPVFSQIQPPPSRSWILTEAKQGQESCDHSVPSAQTRIPASVLRLKREGGLGVTQALQLPTVPPGCVGRRAALTLRFSTPPGVPFPPRNPLRKPEAVNDNIFPIDPGCVATAPPTPRSVSSHLKSCARHFHFLEIV